MKVDFAKLKEQVPIQQAAELLGLDLVPDGQAFRCPCPQCQRGGDRAIVITPAKKAYYCFAEKKGGDCIALVAHVKGMGQRQAAEWLLEQLPQQRENIPRRGNSRDGVRKGKSTAALRLIITDQLKPVNDNVVERPTHDPTDYTDLL
jgi:hypothetical protein